MTKAQFTAKLADKLKLKKAENGRIVDEFTDLIIGTMKKGDRVRFPGFGTFKISKRKARVARNPQTGEPVKVPARNVPRFTAAKELKEAGNRSSLAHGRNPSGPEGRTPPVPLCLWSGILALWRETCYYIMPVVIKVRS